MYFAHNPVFGTEFTIDDILNPSEELYSHVLSNWATLDRKPISFDEWSEKIKRRTIAIRNTEFKCKYVIIEESVSSFDDIENLYRQNKAVKFVDKELNEYFCISL